MDAKTTQANPCAMIHFLQEYTDHTHRGVSTCALHIVTAVQYVGAMQRARYHWLDHEMAVAW